VSASETSRARRFPTETSFRMFKVKFNTLNRTNESFLVRLESFSYKY
jgi:hypothetical protein